MLILTWDTGGGTTRTVTPRESAAGCSGPCGARALWGRGWCLPVGKTLGGRGRREGCSGPPEGSELAWKGTRACSTSAGFVCGEDEGKSSQVLFLSPSGGGQLQKSPEDHPYL